MRDFDLVILTPRATLFDGKATSVVLPTEDGTVGFLAGREATAIEVLPGDVKFKEGESEHILETDGGIAEMNGKRLTILCGEGYDKADAERMRLERTAELSEERERQERSLAEYKLNRAALIRAFDKIRRARTK